LVLVDNDILLPVNISRHVLGFQHLFRNKAEALADELGRAIPYLKVRAYASDMTRIELPGSADLIVDATGEEALSNWLNDVALSRWNRQLSMPPVLHVWVKGPGLAVQSFLHLDGGACFRCLKRLDERGMPCDRFPVAEEGSLDGFRTDSCGSSFMPFSTVASVEAANLALRVIGDWADGRTSPSFRTIRIDGSVTIPVADVTPARLQDCPACASE
jgi:hypothetical protein